MSLFESTTADAAPDLTFRHDESALCVRGQATGDVHAQANVDRPAPLSKLDMSELFFDLNTTTSDGDDLSSESLYTSDDEREDEEIHEYEDLTDEDDCLLGLSYAWPEDDVMQIHPDADIIEALADGNVALEISFDASRASVSDDYYRLLDQQLRELLLDDSATISAVDSSEAPNQRGYIDKVYSGDESNFASGGDVVAAPPSAAIRPIYHYEITAADKAFERPYVESLRHHAKADVEGEDDRTPDSSTPSDSNDLLIEKYLVSATPTYSYKSVAGSGARTSTAASSLSYSLPISNSGFGHFGALNVKYNYQADDSSHCDDGEDDQSSYSGQTNHSGDESDGSAYHEDSADEDADEEADEEESQFASETENCDSEVDSEEHVSFDADELTENDTRSLQAQAHGQIVVWPCPDWELDADDGSADHDERLFDVSGDDNGDDDNDFAYKRPAIRARGL
ncbi:hypothetical protein D9615_005819 [Tricholomella constricta]|uniref:Uncharacterized protein n=1 Tax=Tricholomella constricta TaxID=117010 RepID=A0A8H5HAL7_9AGAR|nr:hypothetical protein D9615_005819 [Tricholomella constricta]